MRWQREGEKPSSTGHTVVRKLWSISDGRRAGWVPHTFPESRPASWTLRETFAARRETLCARQFSRPVTPFPSDLDGSHDSFVLWAPRANLGARHGPVSRPPLPSPVPQRPPGGRRVRSRFSHDGAPRWSVGLTAAAASLRVSATVEARGPEPARRRPTRSNVRSCGAGALVLRLPEAQQEGNAPGLLDLGESRPGCSPGSDRLGNSTREDAAVTPAITRLSPSSGS